MPREIEFKLRLDPKAVDAVAAHPALSGFAAKTLRLQNTYYDTPALDLRRRGIALRFRRKGRTTLLTVKGGNPAAAGLASRNEWETPRRAGEFDFSHVDDPELRSFLDQQVAHLVPLFTTDFVRTQWWIPVAAGGGIEVARDVGSIRAGKRREALCEIELERTGAQDAAPLLALALELSAALPLHPEAPSKAERGYALHSGAQPMPRKTAPSPVAKGMSPREAFQAIAFDSLDQLMRNEAGALSGKDPEFVHQARVGIRRLRSALGLFAPVLPADFVATYREPWREVAAALGDGRDWDVLMHETLPQFAREHPGYEPPKRLLRMARQAHDHGQNTIREALTHPGYSRFLVRFAADLHALGDGDAPIVAVPLPVFARERMSRQLRSVRRKARPAKLRSHDDRHQLRIELKKLRYATDYFAALLPTKPLARYRKRIANLQEILGLLNDLTVGRHLLDTLKSRKAPDPLDNWLASQHGATLKKLRGALDRMLRTPQPWQ